MGPSESFFLALSGLLAGFIDSIAGGGGMVTLPALALVVGLGPLAVGTNKISGVVAAFVALLVYTRSGHLDWKRGGAFCLLVAVGSLVGSRLSPHMPQAAFRIFLLATCPLVLWMIWNRELWVEKAQKERTRGNQLRVALVGLLCGIYDGVWGPGGGTFMFLGLLVFAGLPLMSSLAISKLANTLSAGVALVSFSSQGLVNWRAGFFLASGVAVGASIGARLANKHAARIVRPILTIVAVLLLARVLVG